MKFYTYLWLREDGTPYYVGKGTGRRAYAKLTHRFPPPTKERIIVQEFETEEDAFEAEEFLISYFGREDLGTGILLNLTDGGEGAATNEGKKFSEEHKNKISRALKGNTNGRFTLGLAWTEEHRKLHKKAMKNRVIPPESRSKMGQNRGKRMTKKNLEALVLANTGREVSAITKQRISLANTGKKRTEETKARFRAAWVRRKQRAIAQRNS